MAKARIDDGWMNIEKTAEHLSISKDFLGKFYSVLGIKYSNIALPGAIYQKIRFRKSDVDRWAESRSNRKEAV